MHLELWTLKLVIYVRCDFFGGLILDFFFFILFLWLSCFFYQNKGIAKITNETF